MKEGKSIVQGGMRWRYLAPQPRALTTTEQPRRTLMSRCIKSGWPSDLSGSGSLSGGMPNGEFRYMLLDKVGCNSGPGLENESPGWGSIVLVWESRTNVEPRVAHRTDIASARYGREPRNATGFGAPGFALERRQRRGSGGRIDWGR